jgi:hypothetical protein
MRNKKWVRLLAYVTGSVNRELLLQNEYLAAENRILRAKLSRRLRLNNPERATLAEIGKRLGRRVLAEVACVAKPDTILAWYRKLVAKKFDGSKHRVSEGRLGVNHPLATVAAAEERLKRRFLLERGESAMELQLALAKGCLQERQELAPEHAAQNLHR